MHQFAPSSPTTSSSDHDAAAAHGYPETLLSDNAAVFSGASRKGKVLLETELERLGIQASHATPYHRQTCGKVERFHQTMKRYLAKQPPAVSLGLLQAQLDAFVRRYNDARPHRALGRHTPRQVYETKVKAAPAGRVESHFRVRYDTVDRTGKVSLRCASRLLHIGLGARFKGQKVVLLVAARDVRVVSAAEGELLRHLELDPSRNYQRQSA